MFYGNVADQQMAGSEELAEDVQSAIGRALAVGEQWQEQHE